MPTENVTTKFKVDISDLKKNIADANRQIKLATAEFKNATAGLDNWAKSADGLSAKIKQQNAVVDAEKAKLQALQEQLKRLNTNIQNGESVISDLTAKHAAAAKQYGETSEEAKAYAKQLADAEAAQQRNVKAADDLNLKIINQDTAVKNAESQLGKFETALSEVERTEQDAANKTETLTEKIDRQESELQDLKEKYIEAATAKGKDSEEARELATQISNLSGDLQQNKASLNDASSAADEFDRSLENVDEEANNTTTGGLSAFGVALGNLAANLISAAISKMKDLITETVNVGKTFDTSMSQVSAVSGATGDELEQLRTKAKEMGSTTKFTASEAADAFNYMAMAGWKTEDMINGIDGVLNLAAASGADLATTSDIVTDALTAMGYSAGDAGRLADVMAAASSNANTNVEMMGQTFKYAAPIVGALGYNMEDTAVAIGLMANAGIKANQAGTSLRSILTRLSAPPKECAEAMKQLGISMTDSQGNMKSLDEIMQDLRGAFDGLSETEQTAAAKYIAGQEAMSGLLAIVNAAPEDYAKLTNAVANSSFSIDAVNKSLENSAIQWSEYSDKAWMANGGIEGLADEIIYNVNQIGTSTDDLRKYLEFEYDMNTDDAIKAIEAVTGAMENSEGAAQRMSETMLDNLGGDMTLLSSKLEGVQLALYEKLEPALRSGAEALDKVLDGVQWAVDNLGTVATIIGGVTTAIIAQTVATKAKTIADLAAEKGMTVLQFAQMKLNAAMNANAIGLIIIGITALIAAFKYLWDNCEGFRNFWIGLWEKIKKAFSGFIDAWGVGIDIIKDVLSKIGEWFSAAWDKIKSVWGVVSDWFKQLWENIKNSFAFKVIVNRFKMAWENIKAIWGVVVAYFKTIWENIKLIFSAVKKVLSGDFSGAWDAIKQIFANVKKFFSENVWGAIKNIFSNIDQFFGGIFSKAWEKIKGVWNAVAMWFDTYVIQPIKNFFSPIVEWFSQLFGSIWATIKSVFEVIGQLAAGCVELIKAVWGVVSGWFMDNVVTPVSNFFSALWNGIKTAASTAWNAIKTVWAIVSNWFNTHIIQPVAKFFATMWNGIKTAAQTAWNFIKGIWAVVSGWFNTTIIQPVANFFSNMWEKLKSGAQGAWDGIKHVFSTVAEFFRKTFQTAWEKVKGVFSVGGKIFDGIKDGIVSAFKTVVNAIIRGINKVVSIPFNAINSILDTIQGIEVLDIKPFEWLTARIAVPQIPELEKGGILKKGQIGLLEGNGTEAVLPLEKNTGGLKRIAHMLASEMQTNGAIFGSGSSGDTINNYNFNQTNNSPKALSRFEIYRQTKNLINAVKGV